MTEGHTSLSAGKGDMLVWAVKDGHYAYGKASFGKDSTVKLILTDIHSTEPQQLMIVPPPGHQNVPEVTPEQRAENDRRTAEEDSIRKAYESTFFQDDGTQEGSLLSKAAGNWQVIDKFLKDHPDSRALELLKSLSDKDLIDVTREILDDSYYNTDSVLGPRVENEFLTPYKGFLRQNINVSFSDPKDIVKWVKDNIKIIDDPKALRIPISPKGVFTIKAADSRSRDIFFVALCRTFGFDARKDSVTGKIQYKEGENWIDVDFDSAAQVSAPTGTLVLRYEPTKALANPAYYTNFTISKIVDGSTSLLSFDEGQVDMGGGVSWENVFRDGTSLDEGDYLLVSGLRVSDGSVPVTMQQFSVKEGETTTLDLTIDISDAKLPVIGSFDAETRYKPTADSEAVSVLSVTGRGFYVIGFMEPRKEPSVHAINDLIKAKDDFEKWGRPVVLLTTAAGLEWLDSYRESLPSTVTTGIIPESMESGWKNPRFLLCDTFNKVYYETEGYTIGLGEQLSGALSKL